MKLLFKTFESASLLEHSVLSKGVRDFNLEKTSIYNGFEKTELIFLYS